jgi:hypothetical protein
LERGRRRGDPEHRRQDHLAACGKSAERPVLRPGRRSFPEQQQHERSIPAAADHGRRHGREALCASASRAERGGAVQPVTGAGRRVIATVRSKRLYAGGVKLANGTSVNVYMVKGSVKLSDASGGKQSIRIDWQVLDPTGKKLGTVSQQNMIPRGSLNGPWGAIADAAAGAAADGIIKLLPKSS